MIAEALTSIKRVFSALRNSFRHCERSEAIHAAASGGMDCFVVALNDGEISTGATQ
jgi:hypothetical protein